ncbi:hypothetical protein BJ508DRAFT_327925 [Ascobolus immersus RN42]|uniref:Uncharacterized protein n=1 Tax=Ascobolus immersus RN42 TaxID=1160509 RepID=A0A3N4I1B5_ASCIM|nr:hypothetical protein BJ508DRAFT_327925 [Ascobolus immersus RN42]
MGSYWSSPASNHPESPKPPVKKEPQSPINPLSTIQLQTNLQYPSVCDLHLPPDDEYPEIPYPYLPIELQLQTLDRFFCLEVSPLDAEPFIWNTIGLPLKRELCQWAKKREVNKNIYPHGCNVSVDWEQETPGTRMSPEEELEAAQWMYDGFLLLRQAYKAIQDALEVGIGRSLTEDEISFVWYVPAFSDPKREGFLPNYWFPLKEPYLKEGEVLELGAIAVEETRIHKVIRAHFPSVV